MFDFISIPALINIAVWIDVRECGPGIVFLFILLFSVGMILTEPPSKDDEVDQGGGFFD